MRTKALLSAAAALAVGAFTAHAQGPVYSVNIVGYVNVDLNPGFNMVANPLDNGTNTVPTLFSSLPDFSTVFKFTGGAYEPGNTLIFGAWGDPNQTLFPGEGAFVNNAGATTNTVTFVGEVVGDGGSTNSLISGFNMVSSISPVAGGLTADLGLTPNDFDTVFEFENGAYLPGNTYIFGAWGGGDPQIAVGEAFFISAGSAIDWVQSFSF